MAMPLGNSADVLRTKEDIIRIAFIDYGWRVGDSTEVIFDVVNAQELLENCNDEKLKEIKEPTGKKKLVYIVDVGNSHWVVLVIVYRHKQFFSYFIDPCGEVIPANVKKHLATKKIHCPELKFDQATISNTGIFALRYAEKMCFILRRKRFDEAFLIALKKESKKQPNVNLSNDEFENRDNEPDRERSNDQQPDTNNLILVTVDFCDFKKRMGSLCSNLKESKESVYTLIISSSQAKKSPFALVTLAFYDEQVVACYVAHETTHTKHIEKMLSEEGIVTIFAKDDIKNSIPGIAKFASHFVQKNRKNDYTTTAKNELNAEMKGMADEKDKKTMIEKYTDKLNAIEKVKGKIKKCANWIDKYLTHHGNKVKLEIEDYTYAQINYIILFLESAALEDSMVTSALHSDGKTRLRQTMIQEEDYTLISTIRSKHLLHRGDTINKTIIAREDIKKYIRHDVRRVTLLQKMSAFLTQMMKKFDGEEIVQEIRVGDFFVNMDELHEIKDELRKKQKQVKEVKLHVCKTFKKFLRPISDNSSPFNQRAMFELNINILPLLEGLYAEPWENHPELKELHKLKRGIKHYLHRFLEYEKESARQYLLKVVLSNMKPTIFKFNFSCTVYNFLQDCPNSGSIQQRIDHLFKLEKGGKRRLPTSFAHQMYMTFCSIDRNGLESFIQNYVKIMVAIDNEDQIAFRKSKERSMPQRYGKYILNEKRFDIYHGFRKLKKMNDDGNFSYIGFEREFRKECMKCGILKRVFDSIVDLYVTESHKIKEEFSDKIYDTIIRNEPTRADVEELKISKTCDDTVAKIYKVSAERFVKNIRQLIDSEENRNAITNVQQVFEDQTFLYFLTHHTNSNFSTQVKEELNKIYRFSENVQKLKR